MTRIYLITFFFSITLCLICCHEEPGTINAPNQVNGYTLVYTDTTKLLTATVLLDSVPTSNQATFLKGTSNLGALLIGKYRDKKLGLLAAKALFQVAPASEWTLRDDAEYDSVVLLMNSSKYHYSDTTVIQTIQAREIVEDFKTYSLPKFWKEEQLYSYFSSDADNSQTPDKLYNTSHTKVNEIDKLGEISFVPHFVDTIRMRLNSDKPKENDLGFKWFNLAKDNPAAVNSIGSFLNLFKGIELSSIEESNIIGIVPGSIKVRLYYREKSKDPITDLDVIKNKHYDFPYFGGFLDNAIPYNPSNNYSSIVADRAGTPLENLTAKNNIIPSSQTEEVTYIQSGIGLATKVSFPTLKNLRDVEGFLKINSARLIIEPVANSFDGLVYLPPNLTLFTTNNTNLPLQPLADDSDQSYLQSASLNTEGDPSYTFYITRYAQSLFKDTETDFDNIGLLITTPINSIGNTVTRACIGNGQNADFRARLEIYYLKKD